MSNNIPRKILLNPGPATTTDSVKAAQLVADICPREQEFGELMAEIATELTRLVASPDDYSCVLFSASGTAAVEAAISSTIAEDGSLLIINNGAYGERMQQIAECHGINHIVFNSSLVKPVDLQALEEVISTNPQLTHLAAVHNETTTGLLNDLDALGRLAENYQLQFIVDAMSSYAAVPVDMSSQNISWLCASSNKNIQGMAGVSFVIAPNTALHNLQHIKPRSFYLDLHSQYMSFLNTGQMRFTPPVQTLYALKQAIVETQQEGVEQRYRRYSDSWQALTTGLRKLGLEYLVDDAHHSRIITAIKLPEGLCFDHMHDYFYQRDITLYPGKIDDTQTFRVANIGAIDSNDIQHFLNLLDNYLKTNRS